MKQGIYIFLLALVSLHFSVNCMAQDAKVTQCLSFECNAYRSGDVMQVSEIQIPSNLRNLSEIKTIRKFAEKVCQFSLDTLTVISNGERHHYLQTANRIALVGIENPQNLINYSLPEVKMKFPFAPNDTVRGYFNGEGEYCDKLKIRQFGHYATSCEQIGKISLPEGEEISDAILVRTLREYQIETIPSDSDFIQMASSESDIAQLMVAKTSPTYHEEILTIFAKGYRYPILETIVCKDSASKVLQQHCYYRSPEEQDKLGIDKSNEEVRKASSADNIEHATNSAETGENEEKPYALEFDANSSTISFSLKKTGLKEAILIIADSNGVVYKRSQCNNQSDVNEPFKIDCSRLQSRQYIIYIAIGKEKFSEKFNKK